MTSTPAAPTYSLPSRRTWAACCGFVLLLSLAGCPRHRANQTTVVPDVAVSTVQGILGPLDVVEVRVLDEDEISGPYQIEADGTLYFPYLGAVPVAGLTPGEASELLTEKLGDGYLRRPVVTVRVTQANSRKVVVLGYVKKPGSLPFVDGMTVIQAIAQAGGLMEDAAAGRTRITRVVEGQQETIQVPVLAITGGRAADIPLQPDDVVYVPMSPI